MWHKNYKNSFNIIVRAARQNKLAKQARIDVWAACEAGRQEHYIVAATAIVASIAAPNSVATTAATPAATAAPTPSTIKRTSTKCMSISTLVSPSFNVYALASL